MTTEKPVSRSEPETVTASRAKRGTSHPGTLGGSNRMLSAREVGAMLGVPERTIRERWREWNLPAYRIGKHLRWREREVHAWIDRNTA